MLYFTLQFQKEEEFLREEEAKAVASENSPRKSREDLIGELEPPLGETLTELGPTLIVADKFSDSDESRRREEVCDHVQGKVFLLLIRRPWFGSNQYSWLIFLCTELVIAGLWVAVVSSCWYLWSSLARSLATRSSVIECLHCFSALQTCQDLFVLSDYSLAHFEQRRPWYRPLRGDFTYLNYSHLKVKSQNNLDPFRK